MPALSLAVESGFLHAEIEDLHQDSSMEAVLDLFESVTIARCQTLNITGHNSFPLGQFIKPRRRRVR